MIFSRLLTADKAPFVVTLALGVLGWFITTIITNISEITILGVKKKTKGEYVYYTVRNSSIKRSLSNAVLMLNCQNNDCLSDMGGNVYVVQQDVPPYAIQGNTICVKNEAGSATVLLSLPPGGEVRYQVRPKAKEFPSTIFVGISTACPNTRALLAVESVWIIEGCSLLLLFARYYLHILSIALVLALGVLTYLLFYHRDHETLDSSTRG